MFWGVLYMAGCLEGTTDTITFMILLRKGR